MTQAKETEKGPETGKAPPAESPRRPSQEDIRRIQSVSDQRVAAAESRAEAAEAGLAKANKQIELLGADEDATERAKRLADEGVELERRERRVATAERERVAEILADEAGMSVADLMKATSLEDMQLLAREFKLEQREKALESPKAESESTPDEEAEPVPEASGHDVGGASTIAGQQVDGMSDEQFAKHGERLRSEGLRKRGVG